MIQESDIVRDKHSLNYILRDMQAHGSRETVTGKHPSGRLKRGKSQVDGVGKKQRGAKPSHLHCLLSPATECWGVKTSGVCARPWMTYEDLAYWDWGTRGELVTPELYLVRRRLADSRYSLIQPDRLLSLHVPSSSWHFASTCADEHAQVKRRPPRLRGAVASPRATAAVHAEVDAERHLLGSQRTSTESCLQWYLLQWLRDTWRDKGDEMGGEWQIMSITICYK